MYELIIKKYSKNVNYVEPKANQYDYRGPHELHEYNIDRKLEVEITDEEFKAIKKAVLEVM